MKLTLEATGDADESLAHQTSISEAEPRGFELLGLSIQLKAFLHQPEGGGVKGEWQESSWGATLGKRRQRVPPTPSSLRSLHL